MDSDLRDLIYARSRGYCEVTGAPLPRDGWAAHHRKLRKHGGTDSPQNLLVLSHAAHNLGTESVHLQPKRSYEKGWLVRADQDPAEVPVLLCNRKWVLLLPNGEYLFTKERNEH